MKKYMLRLSSANRTSPDTTLSSSLTDTYTGELRAGILFPQRP